MEAFVFCKTEEEFSFAEICETNHSKKACEVH